jgi:hypothetical protein
MYEIEMQGMAEDFFLCWKAAATYLNNQVDVGIQSWLRGHPYPCGADMECMHVSPDWNEVSHVWRERIQQINPQNTVQI